MKQLINSLIISLTTYSKIPLPQAEWNEKNMKYSICFFPIVGVVIGTLLILWYNFCTYLSLNNIITAAVCSVIPTIVTGGIHMDGFCDTTDALSSHQSTERKLEIMKDSNTGAFALIKCCCYYILYFAFFTQISKEAILIVAASYIMSRILSAFAIVNFKCAKNSGLAAMFKSATQKRNVTLILVISLLISTITIIYIDLFLGLSAFITAILVFIYYKVMSKKQFGGITGDVAGYFLSLCELWILIAVVITERIILL